MLLLPTCKLTNGGKICFLTPDFTRIFDSLSKTFTRIINHIHFHIKALTWKPNHTKRNKEKICSTYILWTTRPEICNRVCKESATNPVFLFSILFNCLGEEIKNTLIRFANNVKLKRMWSRTGNRKQQRKLGNISNMKA